MKIINLITAILAHTGRDEIEHGMEMFDFILGAFILISFALFIVFLIKKYRKKKK